MMRTKELFRRAVITGIQSKKSQYLCGFHFQEDKKPQHLKKSSSNEGDNRRMMHSLSSFWYANDNTRKILQEFIKSFGGGLVTVGGRKKPTDEFLDYYHSYEKKIISNFGNMRRDLCPASLLEKQEMRVFIAFALTESQGLLDHLQNKLRDQYLQTEYDFPSKSLIYTIVIETERRLEQLNSLNDDSIKLHIVKQVEKLTKTINQLKFKLDEYNNADLSQRQGVSTSIR